MAQRAERKTEDKLQDIMMPTPSFYISAALIHCWWAGWFVYQSNMHADTEVCGTQRVCRSINLNSLSSSGRGHRVGVSDGGGGGGVAAV